MDKPTKRFNIRESLLGQGIKQTSKVTFFKQSYFEVGAFPEKLNSFSSTGLKNNFFSALSEFL